MRCPGLRRPCNADAQSASLRENRPPRYARVFPARPSELGLSTPGGAGSARPQGWLELDRGMSPLGYRAVVNGWVGNEVSRPMNGPYLRTRRVRPSEKTALPVMPGFSPLGHPSLDCPPLEGRAPHARKEGIPPTRTSPPIAHRLIVNAPVGMGCLGLGMASARGRTECVPPRKPPWHLGPFPARPSELGLSTPGGAGSARPQGWLQLDRGMSPLGYRAVVNGWVENEVSRPMSGPYLRTRRARPSEKTASRVVSGPSSVRPSVLGLPPPWRGGLRTPAGMASA